jgi:hypothetical protein
MVRDFRKSGRHVLVLSGALMIAPMARAEGVTPQNPAGHQTNEKASSTTPPTSTVAVTSPAGGRGDIVKLKNGGVIRGIIDENMPDKYVVIVTPSGQTRRFDWSEVEYAGAATDVAPAQAASAPSQTATPNAATASSATITETTRPDFTVHGAEAKVSFASKDGTQLLIYVHTNTATLGTGAAEGASVEGYRQLCTTPCAVTMAAGTYTFGVAVPGRKMHAAEPVAVAPGESQFTAGVKSRTGLRVLGWTILGAGSVVGTAMVLNSSEEKCGDGYASDICVSELNSTLLYGGSLVMMASIGVGLGLALGVKDAAEVKPGLPVPGTLPSQRRNAWSLGLSPMMTRGERGVVPSGMNLSLSF